MGEDVEEYGKSNIASAVAGYASGRRLTEGDADVWDFNAEAKQTYSACPRSQPWKCDDAPPGQLLVTAGAEVGQLTMRSFADVSTSEQFNKRTGEFEETPPIVTVRMDAVDGESEDTIELRAVAQDLMKFEADVVDSEDMMTISSKLEGQDGDRLEELMTMGGKMPKFGTTMSGTMNINA